MKAAAALLVTVLLGFVVAANQATADDQTGVTSSNATPSAPRRTKGGQQLWSENCARCHNMRSPGAYSSAEWQVVMHHMRVRANLTAEEHKAILEFLKSSH